MNTLSKLSPLSLIALLGACSQAPQPASPTDEPPAPAVPTQAQTIATPTPDHVQRAQAAMQDLGSALRTALQATMLADGALASVDFCHQEAPRIAGDIADKHGLALGRTSLRPRSPGNTPTDWQHQLLEDFQQRAAAGEPVSDISWVSDDALPEGVALRMMRAIELQPQCQLCHGKEIEPTLAQAIAQRYPDDLATGYSAGDLRGAMWVEVPVASFSDASTGAGTP